MKKTIVFVSLLALLLAGVTAQAQLKKRVAVFTFEDKSEQGWHWWSGGSPGEGMADMLTTELVKSGKYIVVERSEISKIMQEQDLGQTGRVTEQSAAKMGQLLGVELAIMGSVTEFGVTGGVRVKGIGLGSNKQSARVGIDVRLVNTNTGEILAADHIAKEESSGGIRVSTPKFGFNNRTDFDNSLAGKATRAAIEDIMGLIENQMQALPWEGKIILVKGATIYIKPGSDAGVNVGDVFTVYSKGEDLIDPDTGISLGSQESKIGTIKVTSMVSGGKAAMAAAVSGSGFAKDNIIRQQ